MDSQFLVPEFVQLHEFQTDIRLISLWYWIQFGKMKEISIMTVGVGVRGRVVIDARD
jgi:hypothetical protein